MHTTCSDGAYTPAQVVDLARRSGLAALAITDHDTVASLGPAQIAAGRAPEVVPALEMTAVHQGRELHLLGYFIQPENAALVAGLQQLRQQRVERFFELARRLRGRGLSVDSEELTRRLGTSTPGRRHLAAWLVETRQAGSIQQAFDRYLSVTGRLAVPPVGLPVGQAIALVRGAGGVAIWAHPSYDCRQKNVRELVALGLQGIEVEYPGYRADRVKQLRQLAAQFGLVVSGGSDCHGPLPLYRTVGARSITVAELERIRDVAEREH
jgi:predicted metal-dependent phosphoesterase TrpH